MRYHSGHVACKMLHLWMRPSYYGSMTTSTIGFAVADEDRERLERLVQHFGGGNRSAFLRAALPVMESLARAERLRELQARNAERTAAAGQDYDTLLSAIQESYKNGAKG
jgi:Arc/MetJ-type ribon-helix-helix transcriptional regulator